VKTVKSALARSEMNEFNIEIGIVGADRQFRILTPAEVRISWPSSLFLG
jgi:hypothetical protein